MNERKLKPNGLIFNYELGDDHEKRTARLMFRLASEQNARSDEFKRNKKNSMRNKACLCGSKSKFKRCCWNKYH